MENVYQWSNKTKVAFTRMATQDSHLDVDPGETETQAVIIPVDISGIVWESPTYNFAMRVTFCYGATEYFIGQLNIWRKATEFEASIYIDDRGQGSEDDTVVFYFPLSVKSFFLQFKLTGEGTDTYSFEGLASISFNFDEANGASIGMNTTNILDKVHFDIIATNSADDLNRLCFSEPILTEKRVGTISEVIIPFDVPATRTDDYDFTFVDPIPLDEVCLLDAFLNVPFDYDNVFTNRDIRTTDNHVQEVITFTEDPASLDDPTDDWTEDEDLPWHKQLFTPRLFIRIFERIAKREPKGFGSIDQIERAKDYLHLTIGDKQHEVKVEKSDD